MQRLRILAFIGGLNLTLTWMHCCLDAPRAYADSIILQDDFSALQSVSSSVSDRVYLPAVAVLGGTRSGFLDEDSTTAATFSQNALQSTANKNLIFDLDYSLTSSQTINPAATTFALRGQGNLGGSAVVSVLRFWAFSGLSSTRWDIPIASGVIDDFVFSLNSTPIAEVNGGVNWNNVTQFKTQITINRYDTHPAAGVDYVFDSLTVSAVPEASPFLFLLMAMAGIGVVRGTTVWRASQRGSHASRE